MRRIGLTDPMDAARRTGGQRFRKQMNPPTKPIVRNQVTSSGRWRAARQVVWAERIEKMSKNIVVCLDGTGNEVKASGRTNVLKLFELLDLTNPELQVGYYDPGVGTFAAPSAWSAPARALSRLGGMAIGNGMRQNLGEAYTYLMKTWEPGDQVFLFGFSRGAYTARALAGMVHRIGLLRPESPNMIPYAVSVYA